MRIGVSLAALAALANAASAQPPSDVSVTERVERGALRLENVPETPPDVTERLLQYVNTRSAVLADWTPDGGVLILTRFADTAQLHRVDAPMGARTQLTFFAERVSAGLVRPQQASILFTRDTGGNEQFGGYLFDAASGLASQFTEPNTRNENFIWRDDGALAAWSLARFGRLRHLPRRSLEPCFAARRA